ncbi:hypothetical protein JHK85_015389 [Glycine max]|nr:hypothetical protein JHK85_015389 [Glycine max]
MNTDSSTSQFPVSQLNFSRQIKARKEEGVSINPTFNVSVIFGKRDEPMLVACARQMIEHMSLSGSSRPLVLSLGLKDHSVETLKGIVSAVMDNNMW